MVGKPQIAVRHRRTACRGIVATAVAVMTVAVSTDARSPDPTPSSARLQQRPTAQPLEQPPPVAVVVCDRRYRGIPTDAARRLSGTFRPATIRTRVQPRYTRRALEAGVRGLVSVEFVVAADGSVGDVCVKHPLHPELDASAVAAVKAWQWQPATLDGTAVDDAGHSLDFYFDGQSVEALRQPPDLDPDVVSRTSVRPCVPGPLPADVIPLRNLVGLARTSVVEMPLIVDTVHPTIPPQVMREGVQGNVTVEFIVRSDGSVSDACVRTSLHPLLDATAIAKVEATRFLPGTVDGKPTAMQSGLALGFSYSSPRR